jgi:sulfite exporter TauE/SafE
MAASGFLAEALALGISSGPACLASCGPVLMPALAAERRDARGAGVVLAGFLAGRFGGYLAFGCAAWAAGRTLDLAPDARVVAFGVANLVMALVLVLYAQTLARGPAACEGECPAARARRFADRFGSAAPLLLGFVSGVSLCPPFLAAGVRAAQGQGLAAALVFFTCFFVGTSVWFAPSLALVLLRRFVGVAVVARLVLFLLAGYYLYLALILLGGWMLRG